MRAIVAVDDKWGIGKDGKLLFSVPADMKFFKEKTTGKVVVMGSKTLKSFPGGLPLKNCQFPLAPARETAYNKRYSGAAAHRCK